MCKNCKKDEPLRAEQRGDVSTRLRIDNTQNEHYIDCRDGPGICCEKQHRQIPLRYLFAHPYGIGPICL